MNKILSVFTLLCLTMTLGVVSAQEIPFEPNPGDIPLDSSLDSPFNFNSGFENTVVIEPSEDGKEIISQTIYNISNNSLQIQTFPQRAAYYNESLNGQCLPQDNNSYILNSKWEVNNSKFRFTSNLKKGAVGLGSGYQCMIRNNDSRVLCWGNSNSYGEMGVGDTLSRATPQLVNDETQYESVVPFYFHTCGIRSDGRATCWGRNDRRQLGIGTTGQRNAPTLVDDGSEYIDISPGGFHTCGIRSDGQATCWGIASQGRLGSGMSTGDQQTPINVTGNHNFTQISAGLYHTCAIDNNSEVYCWGAGNNGRLGYGGTGNRNYPVKVDIDKKFIEVKAFSVHNCAITKEHDMYCWGYNNYGQLGTGDTNTRTRPTKIESNSKVKGLALTYAESCGITFDNELLCMGRNYGGQFGTGTFSSSLLPIKSEINKSLTGISLAGNYACGLDENSDLYCFGSSVDSVDQRTYLPNQFNITYTDLTVGSGSACGKNNDSYYCWGVNRHLQIGQEDISFSNIPQKIEVNYTLKNVSGLSSNYCGIRENDNDTVCWGYNSYGQLGDGTQDNSATPVVVLSDQEFVEVKSGSRHSCGITKQGKVYCWGQNNFRQFGDGSTSSSNVPVLSANNISFDKMKLHYFGGCAMRKNTSKLMCWGYNTYGQVGDSSTTNRATPVNLAGNHDYVDFWTGRWYNCGKRTDNKTYCWGYNSDGQLGDGTTSNKNSPSEVNTNVEFVDISLGIRHSCGISVNNSLYCWGFEGFYTSNGTASLTSPKQIFTNKTFKEIAIGSDASCALSTDNETICFGYNEFGQTGGDFSNPLQPSKVNLGFSVKRSLTSSNVSSTITPDLTSVGDVWQYSCRGVTASNKTWFSVQNITVHDGPQIRIQSNPFRNGSIERNEIQRYRSRITCLYDDCGDVNLSLHQTTTAFKAYKEKVENENQSNMFIPKNEFDMLFTTIQTNNESNYTKTVIETAEGWNVTVQDENEILQSNFSVNLLKLNSLAKIKGVKQGFTSSKTIENTFNTSSITVLLTKGAVANITNQSIHIQHEEAQIGYALLNTSGIQYLNVTTTTYQNKDIIKNEEVNVLQLQSTNQTPHFKTPHFTTYNETHLQIKVCTQISCDINKTVLGLKTVQETITTQTQNVLNKTKNNTTNYITQKTNLNSSCLQNMSAFTTCQIPIRIVTKQNNFEAFNIELKTTSDAADDQKNLSSYQVIGDAAPKKTLYTNSTIDINDPEGWENTTLRLEKTKKGIIQWKSPVNVTKRNFDENIVIENNKIQVNTQALGQGYDEPALIIFKEIQWQNPEILRDGTVCKECTILSYNNNELEVEVPGFSTYTSREKQKSLSGGSSPRETEDVILSYDELQNGAALTLDLYQKAILYFENDITTNFSVTSFNTNYVNTLLNNDQFEIELNTSKSYVYENENLSILYQARNTSGYHFFIQISDIEESVEEVVENTTVQIPREINNSQNTSQTITEITETQKTTWQNNFWIWLALLSVVFIIIFSYFQKNKEETK